MLKIALAVVAIVLAPLTMPDAAGPEGLLVRVTIVDVESQAVRDNGMQFGARTLRDGLLRISTPEEVAALRLLGLDNAVRHIPAFVAPIGSSIVAGVLDGEELSCSTTALPGADGGHLVRLRGSSLFGADAIGAGSIDVVVDGQSGSCVRGIRSESGRLRYVFVSLQRVAPSTTSEPATGSPAAAPRSRSTQARVWTGNETSTSSPRGWMTATRRS